jgi:hypothetical protein
MMSAVDSICFYWRPSRAARLARPRANECSNTRSQPASVLIDPPGEFVSVPRNLALLFIGGVEIEKPHRGQCAHPPSFRGGKLSRQSICTPKMFMPARRFHGAARQSCWRQNQGPRLFAIALLMTSDFIVLRRFRRAG